MITSADKTNELYYSMSSQILVERKQYYAILQKVQHSNGDITDWLDWFLHCLKNSLIATEVTLQKILRKNEFWIIHENTAFNERQRLVLNKLFDGFDGKLKSSKSFSWCFQGKFTSPVIFLNNAGFAGKKEVQEISPRFESLSPL